MTWVLDLDGVVWLGDQPIAGAAGAVHALRARGEQVLFLTNNSSATVETYRLKLAAAGIDSDGTDVVTSAQAAASLVPSGARVLVAGGPGVVEALSARGADVVRDGDADFVVVGWHREFDYDRLAAAARAVRRGAVLVGTNDDPTYPTPDGPVPGAGSLLAAVAYAAEVDPMVAGKPYDPVVALLADRAADVRMLVGDRPSTDGLLARRLGVAFGLVLSGVTSPDDLPVDPEPDVVATDLAALVQNAA